MSCPEDDNECMVYVCYIVAWTRPLQIYVCFFSYRPNLRTNKSYHDYMIICVRDAETNVAKFREIRCSKTTILSTNQCYYNHMIIVCSRPVNDGKWVNISVSAFLLFYFLVDKLLFHQHLVNWHYTCKSGILFSFLKPYQKALLLLR